MGFSTSTPPVEELRERVFTTAAEFPSAAVTSDTFAIADERFPADLEASVRPLVAAALVRHPYPPREIPGPGNCCLRAFCCV